MTEIERAEEYADSFIKMFAKTGNVFSVTNGDFINEDTGFQELVIQHIRLRGYIVKRHYCSWDGLSLQLFLDHSA